MKAFWKEGTPWIWLTATFMNMTILMLLVLCGVVFYNGILYFWPDDVVQVNNREDGKKYLGVLKKDETVPQSKARRIQLKVGNREIYGFDHKWLDNADLSGEISTPLNAVVLERHENGNYIGYLKSVNRGPHAPALSGDLDEDFAVLLDHAHQRLDEILFLQDEISTYNDLIERARLKEKKIRYKTGVLENPEILQLRHDVHTWVSKCDQLVEKQQKLRAEIDENSVTVTAASGEENTFSMRQLVRAYYPNRMGVLSKLGYFCLKIKELLLDEPREANTEGGIFPAIYGTVVAVFLMSLLCFPLGVIAGIYLREYSKAGMLVRVIRIAVNNLAGIPSIVYGIFGLGFFIYGMGSAIDNIFYPESLPSPTFGAGGVLWASLTLGLLTVPVVIVATQEALGAIPPGIREGSLALGATKLQTLIKILLPMASPGIMTGFILAMSRAAGEVAPLILTGVVKLAPSLPIDGTFPFVHLQRKFMHLGFHIYDVGFQSPNVEAAKPMVFVTTLVLLMVVVIMNSTAIWLRNRMKAKMAGSIF